ncbi:MAG: OB-fold nucleic acid binding domain-containing protein [Micropruina sp.]|nr:OB-fold nucleic acid binding domain-containing protein [Micropruina sp.]
MAGTNPFLRALRRLGVSNAELESEERRQIAITAGAQQIAEVGDRQRARLRGTLTELTMKPRSGTPWLEAEFTDGSGSVTLIWMGRRSIPGVIAGREVLIEGRVSAEGGRRRIYNPHYQLL